MSTIYCVCCCMSIAEDQYDYHMNLHPFAKKMLQNQTLFQSNEYEHAQLFFDIFHSTFSSWGTYMNWRKKRNLHNTDLVEKIKKFPRGTTSKKILDMFNTLWEEDDLYQIWKSSLRAVDIQLFLEKFEKGCGSSL